MKVVVLASGGTPTNILVNYLDDAGIPPVAVLIEPSQSRRALLRGRARRLGRRAVFGQALFMALVLPVLRRRGAVVRDPVVVHPFVVFVRNSSAIQRRKFYITTLKYFDATEPRVKANSS